MDHYKLLLVGFFGFLAMIYSFQLVDNYWAKKYEAEKFAACVQATKNPAVCKLASD